MNEADTIFLYLYNYLTIVMQNWLYFYAGEIWKYISFCNMPCNL